MDFTQRFIVCYVLPRLPIRITNAAATYTIMLLVFVAGMWMILVYGSTLEAPHDLAGEWELSPEGRSDAEPIDMLLEQSGKYVRMRIGEHRFDLRVVHSDGRIELRGDGVAARFDPSPSRQVYRVTLQTPQLEERRYSARITRPTHSLHPNTHAH
jgi:hypothetical protein